MISVLIVPNTPEYHEKCSSISSSVLLYPPNPNYLGCLCPEEVPTSFQDELVPAIFETGFSEPVHANQHYYFQTEDIYNPETGRELMALRSRLNYAISENLGPDDFYVHLNNSPNDDQTLRPYRYELKYKDILCQLTPDLYELFQKSLESNLGPLVVSTFGLRDLSAPQWYIRETFRDIVEMNELEPILDLPNPLLVEGSFSSELYLFYPEVVNLTEDILEEMAQQIYGKLHLNMELKIFPRKTPPHQGQTRQLQLLPSGQWKISYDVPKNIPVFSDRWNIKFTLSDLFTLFWFLMQLKMAPTRSFIEKELTIRLNPTFIEVRYETEYLPDFIRVQSASYIQPSAGNLPIDFQVKVIYPDRLSLDEKSSQRQGNVWISFQDEAHHETANLIASGDGDFWKPPSLSVEAVSDYSLENRLERDRDLSF